MSVKPYTDSAGRVWKPYSVEFRSPDSAVGAAEGVFSVTIHAISDLHAVLQVEALRETAAVKGELLGTWHMGET